MRKAIVGLRKQARGEDLQRVAELEESLKKLEDMLTWSVEEREQRRQEGQRRQGEREHAAMRNVETSARMAAKMTAVTSATAGAGDKGTDETSRKGKGNGNGGKGEHEGKGEVGRKGMQQVEHLVMDEIQENHREDSRKLVKMMQKEGSGAEWRLTWGLVAHTPRPCRSQKGKRRKG